MAKPRQASTSRLLIWRPLLTRFVLFAAIWWLLTGGGTDAWGMGAVAVPATLLISLRLLPAGPRRVSISGLILFAGFFIFRSIIAGTQVARIVLRPRLEVRPTMREFELHLTHESERVFLASTLSLLPGTLTAGLDGNTLRMHVLDERMPVEEELRDVEKRVARLFRSGAA